MSRGTPPEPTDPDGGGLDELIATVESLRAELHELRAALAQELRTQQVHTQRVVLTESDGFERLVAAARGGFAHVTLYRRTGDDQPTCVELFANDPTDGTGAHVGAALTNRGEVVATFETTQRSRPTLWLGDDEPT